MIRGLDHVVIAVREIGAGIRTYETLLGRAAMPPVERDGVATALIALENIAVELMAPVGESVGAQRLRAAMEDGEGLKSLVFRTADIEALHRRAVRVGLEPQAINLRDGARSFRLDTERTHGVRVFSMAREKPLTPAPMVDGAVAGLDHVVIQSSDMERAAALYGARLGLDMRLDRELMGRRLMFFRCGDAVVEIVQSEAAARDVLWGLSWRVADAAEARERLAAAGLDVSEVREGMKPGTRVFTVREGACGVPTLMLEWKPNTRGL